MSIVLKYSNLLCQQCSVDCLQCIVQHISNPHFLVCGRD
jgi:hypothetical protein